MRPKALAFSGCKCGQTIKNETRRTTCVTRTVAVKNPKIWKASPRSVRWNRSGSAMEKRRVTLADIRSRKTSRICGCFERNLKGNLLLNPRALTIMGPREIIFYTRTRWQRSKSYESFPVSYSRHIFDFISADHGRPGRRTDFFTAFCHPGICQVSGCIGLALFEPYCRRIGRLCLCAQKDGGFLPFHPLDCLLKSGRTGGILPECAYRQET